ncbi:GNAT family N-acetyltransferase [Defluviicoccus vanus]|uniref:GNAT family N-acetyltransferase n=1 Tax=Defluviicoccus vanus TaxID=111831 RepID=UPI001CBA6373|nr:GNAT family N-acetyltransferase [Defluviicoccus vanus]
MCGQWRGGLGFILCRVAADEAEVLTLAVRPRRRRCGIGRLLLEEAMDVARSMGARQLFLEVGENNTAAGNLYLSMGLQTNGRRRGYYRLKAGGGRRLDHGMQSLSRPLRITLCACEFAACACLLCR